MLFRAIVLRLLAWAEFILKGIHVGTVKSVSSTKNAIDRYAGD